MVLMSFYLEESNGMVVPEDVSGKFTFCGAGYFSEVGDGFSLRCYCFNLSHP